MKLHLFQNAGSFTASDLGNVILIFQQGSEGAIDGGWVQCYLVQLNQSIGPVQRLCNPGQFEQIFLAQTLNKIHQQLTELLIDSGIFLCTISSSRSAAGKSTQ